MCDGITNSYVFFGLVWFGLNMTTMILSMFTILNYPFDWIGWNGTKRKREKERSNPFKCKRNFPILMCVCVCDQVHIQLHMGQHLLTFPSNRLMFYMLSKRMF